MPTGRASRVKAMLLLLAALSAWPAQALALTAEQARDLPEPELARLVLGEAGALFTEVQRPREAAPRRGGDGPRSTSLTFFGRAYPVWARKGMEGMCQAQRAVVTLSDQGAVTDVGVDEVYGFSTLSFGSNPHPTPAHESALREQCAAVSAQSFIRVANPSDLAFALDGAMQVGVAMAQGGAPWLTRTCLPTDSSCQHGQTGPGEVFSVTTCAQGWQQGDPSGDGQDRCLMVALSGPACVIARNLRLIFADEGDRIAIRAANYSQGMIVCH